MIDVRPWGESRLILLPSRLHLVGCMGNLIDRIVRGNGIQPMHRSGPNYRVREEGVERHWD